MLGFPGTFRLNATVPDHELAHRLGLVRREVVGITGSACFRGDGVQSARFGNAYPRGARLPAGPGGWRVVKARAPAGGAWCRPTTPLGTLAGARPSRSPLAPDDDVGLLRHPPQEQ